MLQVGDQAPDFELLTQHGTSVRLVDYRGRQVALYFYPKDHTPGCTRQACNLRDNIELLQEEGIQVLGVSGDSVRTHANFAGKHDLPFLLLADTDGQVLRTYGVWGEKKMFGRTFLGIRRTTFLIDEDGVIQHIFRRPKVRLHAEELLAASGA